MKESSHVPKPNSLGFTLTLVLTFKSPDQPRVYPRKFNAVIRWNVMQYKGKQLSKTKRISITVWCKGLFWKICARYDLGPPLQHAATLSVPVYES